MSGFEVSVLVISVTGNVLLGSLSFLRNQRSATNQVFALLSVIFALWAVATFFAVNAQTPTGALWATRFVMLLAVPQAVLFMLLMHTFPRTTFELSKKMLIVIAVLATAVAVFTLSPFVFTGVELVPGAAPQPQPGVGMLAFVPLAVGSVLVGFYFLIKKNLYSKGLERVQSRYLLLGASIMFLLIISFNFIGVAFLRRSSLATYGPLFTLPFVAMTAYTIARYRLLDIRAAIFRTLSSAVLIGAVLSIYSLLLVFAVPIVANFLNIKVDIIAAAAALISIPLARYAQNSLRQITDHFLFQKSINLHTELVRVGERLSRTIDDKQVNNILLEALTKVIRSQSVTIWLRNNDDKYLVPRSSTKGRLIGLSLPNDHDIIQWLTKHIEPLVADEIPFRRERATNQEIIQQLKSIETALEWLDAEVLVPLFLDDGLSGIIALGAKKSGAPYSQDDIEFLASVAPQAATALNNAQLYQESLEFGQRLEEEVNRATHELEIANEQLKDLDKAKSEFLSIASHQLYTPLTAIRGYLSMLQEGDFGDVTNKQGPVIDILDKSADRLITLIKNLLDISRIESGRLELNLESIDLGVMARELVQDLLPNAMKKNIDLTFEPPVGNLSHVVADQQRLRQVMLNFIDNAIKYTEQGIIKVSVTRRDDELLFAVADTGKGLSAEEINKLFTKFTRVGGASRFHTEGTGLGLYVARQIVKEHRGDVNVTSLGKGKGSTFSMRLPAEGSPRSLKLGDHATVVIKAAEAQGIPA